MFQAFDIQQTAGLNAHYLAIEEKTYGYNGQLKEMRICYQDATKQISKVVQRLKENGYQVIFPTGVPHGRMILPYVLETFDGE